MSYVEKVFITSVMTGCIIPVAVSNLMMLIMVLIPVLKDIKVVSSGHSAPQPSAPVLHRSAPGVLLLLGWALLCRHGQRYVPLVYKWSSRRWLFAWSNCSSGWRNMMTAVSAKGISPGHSGDLAVAVEVAEFSVPSHA